MLIQQFYTEKLKSDMVPQNVAMKVDRPRKNSFQPTFLDAEQMQKLFGKSEQLPQAEKPMP